jgi:hypothetical protein
LTRRSSSTRSSSVISTGDTVRAIRYFTRGMIIIQLIYRTLH